MLEGKFIALNTYIRQEQMLKINELRVYLKKFEKEQENKAMERRRKDIIRIKAKNNDSKINIQKRIKKDKDWFFERTNKTRSCWQVC